MRDLIYCVLFFGMAVYSLQSAFLGMTLWVWSALWPVNDYVYGFAKGIPFNKIAVACTILPMLWDKNKKIAIDPLLGCLILLLVEISLSYFSANTPPGWGANYYENMVKIVIAALVLRFVAVERLKLQACMLAFGAAVGSGAADESLKFILSGGAHHVLGPSSWGDENSTATIILMAIPVLLYLHSYALHRVLRIIAIGTLVLCIAGIVGTYSRGGFIGLTLLSLMLFKRSQRKIRNILVITLLLLIGVSFLPDSWFARILTTTHAEEDSSFMYRVVQWKILTLMAFDKPMLGNGILANMEPSTWHNYASRLNSELTFVTTPPPLVPQASHSIFFQMLGENGFIGLGLFLLLFVLAFRTAKAIRAAAADRPDLRWAGDMAMALRVSLIIYLVTGAVLPIPYLEFPYLIIGCLSALRNVQKMAMRTAVLPDRPRPAWRQAPAGG